MDQFTPGERVKFFREHLGLSQKAFGMAFDMSRGNISKIETGEIGLSNSCLFGMMYSYSANPEWIKTGEGEMFISAKEYFINGVKLLGTKQVGEGFVELFKDPQFAELQSIVALGEMTKGSIDPKLQAYLHYILDKWNQGDETVRGWLMIQLGIAFQEVAKRLQE